MTQYNRVAATGALLPVEEIAIADELFPRYRLNAKGQVEKGSGVIAPTLQAERSITLVGPALTLTNEALADGFLAASNAHIHPIDLNGANQVRLTGRVTVVGAAAHKIQARIRDGAFSTTVSEYLIMGATSVEIGTVAVGVIDSGWIEIVSGFKKDGLFLALCSIGGDGALDPVVANIRLDIR